MNRFLKIGGWVLAVILILAAGGVGSARLIAGRRYNRQWTTHEVSFPIPFPLSDAELETLRRDRLAAGARAADPLAGVDLREVALSRAVVPGRASGQDAGQLPRMPRPRFLSAGRC